VTFLDSPAAAIGALLVVAAVRWAWASARRRAWQWGLVVGLALFAVWRILRMDDGPLTTLDVMLGFLAGLLLFSAIKSAWADGVFEKPERGHENTPMFVLLVAGSLALLLVAYGFGGRWLAWEQPPESEQVTTLPPGGLHVDVLPPGNWE
jgi:hypothetical protein